MSQTENNSRDEQVAFEVTYRCENCGAKWSDQYPSRTKIHNGEQVKTYNKDCDHLGTTGCDCCHGIRCPVCDLVNDITISDRGPVGGEDGV